MDYWEGPARWINTILLVIVAFVGFDTLFRLLNANEENVIVGTVAAVAGFFLAPFEGMFPDQEFLLTAIIAVLGYSLLAGIALAVTRSVAASRRARARRRTGEGEDEADGPAAPEARGHQAPAGPRAGESDTTRPLGAPPGQAEGTGSGGDDDPTRPVGPADTEDADDTRPTPRGERGGAGDDRTQRLS